MSSIEDLLKRDIATITGGVDVTETQLSEARAEVAQRVETSRRRRRQVVTAGLAAAVVVPLVAVGAVRALDGATGEEEPAPAIPGDPDASQGTAVNPDILEGVWRVDNGGTYLRFHQSPTTMAIAIDDRGQVFSDPLIKGTYEIDGDQVRADVTGGRGGCEGQAIEFRAVTAGDGRVSVDFARPGTGACAPEGGGSWTLEQVLPTPPGIAELRPDGADASWQPLTPVFSIEGLWMAVGGGHAVELSPDGDYLVAGASGQPVDRGQWTFNDRELTLTSSAGSRECRPGDRLSWRGLEFTDPGTMMFRGTPVSNDCGATWGERGWILIPHNG